MRDEAGEAGRSQNTKVFLCLEKEHKGNEELVRNLTSLDLI